MTTLPESVFPESGHLTPTAPASPFASPERAGSTAHSTGPTLGDPIPSAVSSAPRAATEPTTAPAPTTLADYVKSQPRERLDRIATDVNEAAKVEEEFGRLSQPGQLRPPASAVPSTLEEYIRSLPRERIDRIANDVNEAAKVEEEFGQLSVPTEQRHSPAPSLSNSFDASNEAEVRTFLAGLKDADPQAFDSIAAGTPGAWESALQSDAQNFARFQQEGFRNLTNGDHAFLSWASHRGLVKLSRPIQPGDPTDPLAPDAAPELFEAWKQSQPELPLGEHVASVAKHTLSGLWEAAKTVTKTAVMAPLAPVDAGVRRDMVATASETVAEAYKQSAVTGLYAHVMNAKLHRTLGDKLHGSDAAVITAERNYYRFLRDLSASSKDGRQIADAIFDNKKNELGSTPVNEEGVQMLAGFVGDPSIAASVVRSSARIATSAVLRDVARAEALNRVPQIGALAAAERAAVETATRKTATEAEVLATKSAGGTVSAELEKQLASESAEAASAAVNFKAQVEQLREAQLAVNDKGALQSAAGTALAKTGAAVEATGDILSRFVDRVGKSSAALEAGDATLGQAATVGVGKVARAIPVIGRSLTESGADSIRSAGNVAKVAGAEMAARESSIPYFQRVARALPEGTVGRWAASQAQRVEFLASTGRYAFDTAQGIGEGALLGGAFGTLNGDPIGGATQGALFGTAGSQFGIMRRWNSPEQVRAQQLVDIEIARQRRPEAQQKEFSKLPEPVQLAVASIEQAHPDLHVDFVHEKGNGAAGWYDYANGVGRVTIDLDHATPLAGLVSHEVKHHLARNPAIAQAVESKILGDVDSGNPGLFTARDAEGKPIVIETPNAENPEVPRRSFKLSPEFYELREQYLQRLRNRNLPTIEYERNDALIAHELWAEAEGVNLLHRQPNGAFDVVALGRMNALQGKVADLASGSNLVRNSAFIQNTLAKFGVVFDGLSGRAANTGLFSKSFDVAELRRAAVEYYRTLEIERRMPDDADHRDARHYTDAEILSSPALQEMFAAGHDVVRDPASGKFRFVREREANKRAEEFAQTLTNELDQYVGTEPNVVKRVEAVDALGRKTTIWSGRVIPEPVIAKMEQSGRFNPTQLNNLRTLSKLLAQDGGNEVNMLYQPASKRGGKLYRTRPITERTETPMALRITADGNVVVSTISQEKLMRNAVDAVKTGKAKLWHNDFSALWADVQTYLSNHASGKPGDTGIGVQKRDFINSLFGQFTAAQRELNPLLQDVSEKRARNMGIVQSRRIDRINRLHVLSTTFRPDYSKVVRNYAPADSHSGRPNPIQ